MRYLWIEHSSGDLPGWVPAAMDRVAALGFQCIYTVPPDSWYVRNVYEHLPENVIGGFKVANVFQNSGFYDAAKWAMVANVIKAYRDARVSWFQRWLGFLLGNPRPPAVVMEFERYFKQLFAHHAATNTEPDYNEIEKRFRELPSDVEYWFYPIAKVPAGQELWLREIALRFQKAHPTARFIDADRHMQPPCAFFDGFARFTAQLLAKTGRKPLHMRYIYEVWPDEGWHRATVSKECGDNTILYPGSGEDDVNAMLEQLESEASQ